MWVDSKKKEEIVISDTVFKEMERTYHSKRYTVDPNTLDQESHRMIGNLEKATEMEGNS